MKTKFRVGLLLLCLCMVVGFASFTSANAASGAANITMAVNKAEVNVGDTVTVTLSCNEHIVSGFGLYLEFNKELLECTEILGQDGDDYYYILYLNEKGKEKEADPQVYDDVENTNSDGIYSLGWVPGSDTTICEQDLITLTFTAKAAGEVTFTLNENSSGADAFKGVAETKALTIKATTPVCDHGEDKGKTPTFISLGNGNHKITYTCDCGASLPDMTIESTPCSDTYNNSKPAEAVADGLCDGCDAVMPCNHTNTKAVPNDDGLTHKLVCTNAACNEYVVTASENCSGGTATCSDKAVCEKCEQAYGATNDENHVSSTPKSIPNGNGTHNVYNYCSCGDQLGLVNANVPCTEGETVDNKCDACGAELSHVCAPTIQTGLTATCGTAGYKDYYKCSCGNLYEDAGAQNPITGFAAWKAEGGNGYIAATGAHVDGEDADHNCDKCPAVNVDDGCHGGTADCKNLAVCEECGKPYGTVAADNHIGTIVYTNNGENHSSKYNCCNAPVKTEEAHTYVEAICACGAVEFVGWGKSGDNWYYIDPETKTKATGVARAPYNAELGYAPDQETLDYCAAKEKTFVDAESALFVFDEETGKFQSSLTGKTEYLNVTRYVKNGLLVWNPGFVTLEGEGLVYFIGDEENGGNMPADGLTYIVRVNGAEGYTKGDVVLLDNGSISTFSGVKDGYYYENGKLVPGKGLVQLGTDYYYVRSSGQVATGWYYVTKTNGMDLGTNKLFFGEDGKMAPVINGIVEESGKLYYYVGNRKACGAGLMKLDDGSIIYVRSSGQLVTGEYYVTNVNDMEGFKPGDLLVFDDAGKLVTE